MYPNNKEHLSFDLGWYNYVDQVASMIILFK